MSLSARVIRSFKMKWEKKQGPNSRLSTDAVLRIFDTNFVLSADFILTKDVIPFNSYRVAENQFNDLANDTKEISSILIRMQTKFGAREREKKYALIQFPQFNIYFIRFNTHASKFYGFSKYLPTHMCRVHAYNMKCWPSNILFMMHLYMKINFNFGKQHRW